MLETVVSRPRSACGAGFGKFAAVCVRDAEGVGREATIGQTTATRWQQRRIPAKADSRSSVIVMCHEVAPMTSNMKIYILKCIGMTIGVAN